MIYKNIKETLTLKNVYLKDGRNLAPDDLGVMNNLSIVEEDGKIIWVGETYALPCPLKSHHKIIDCSDLICIPGLVDSHTHLVFGGNRSFEYTMKLNGKSYEEIASAGGGILNTMESTNNLTKEDLLDLSRERINEVIKYGVKTVEIKSGYALNYEKEKELSEIIFELKNEFKDKIDIFNTYMAAHAIPNGYTSNKYVEEIVIPLMRELHEKKIIDAVDIFHEIGYFDSKDVELLFNEAKKINLPRKIHADEFNDNKGAILASRFEALSCDHLLKTQDDGIDALIESDTVATLLPGTAFFLGKPLANARNFLDKGVKVAIATDFNPGSSHIDNLLLVAQLAGKNLNMNVAEIFASITYNAACALGYKKRGAIMEGLDSKLSFFKASSYHEILYSWGKNLAVNPLDFSLRDQETHCS